MINLEQVEKLRKYAGISFEEAKLALEESDGDILDAIVKLEREEKIEAPSGGQYYYSSQDQQVEQERVYEDQGSSLSELVGKFFNWLGRAFTRANKNSIEIRRKSKKVMEFPITILLLLLLAAFWITIPLLIVGLFFGFSYSFKGPDLGREDLNKAMEDVAEAAENLKKEIKED